MGTWDAGLLDNDTALDGLGHLADGVVEDLIQAAGGEPGAKTTDTLCVAVGVLLQLSGWDFDLESASGQKIVEALQQQAEALGKLPAPARELMNAVMSGKGRELAERTAAAGEVDRLLNSGTRGARFGPRYEPLFASKAAARYVQTIAKRCVEAIDEDFEDESNWSDLCREGMGMGHLAALTALEPCKVPPTKIARWRKLAKQGLAELREAADGELEFHEKYYANLDKVFAHLLARFG